MRARLSVTTQETAIPAPTPTPPPDLPDWLLDWLLPEVALLLALGRVPTPLLPVLGLLATVSPVVWSLLLGWSAGGSPAAESLLLLPLALPVALTALLVSLDAVRAAPTTVTLRASSAVVVQCRTRLRATAAPMAALLPAALASASVLLASRVWVAVIVSSPVVVQVPARVPTRAVVWSSLTSSSATAGLIAVPPLEPASTVVSVVRPEVASTVTLRPPVSAAPSSTSARVTVGTRMLSATDAPTPTLDEPPSALEVAFATSFSVWVARNVRSPVESVTFAVEGMKASVWTTTMLRARAPATPTSSALLDPAMAIALIVCVLSAPTAVMVASTSRPVAVTVDPPVVARLVMWTRLTTTPAPMPALPSITASPLALPRTSVLAEDFKVSAPVSHVTVTPSARKAREVVSTIAMATAPARLRLAPPSSLVAALGVELAPVVEPVLLVCVDLAWSSCWSPLPLTSLPPPEVPSSFFSPLPLAAASVVVADEPAAVKLIGPSACRLRLLPASTTSVTTPRASEIPMPTLELSTSPAAAVLVVAVWVAAAVRSPVSVRVRPRPRVARVVMLAMVTATVGAIAAVLPDEPPSASVSTASVALASSSSECAPVSTGALTALVVQSSRPA